MRNYFRPKGTTEVPSVDPVEARQAALAALDAEEHRWEGFIEGTDHDTSMILRGLADVARRRAELEASQDQAQGLPADQ
jgi:hypothetical protein